MKKIVCSLLGHRPAWTQEYQLVYYDPDPTHTLICERCQQHLDPVTYRAYTPKYIGRIW